jgi:hypothetical protein
MIAKSGMWWGKGQECMKCYVKGHHLTILEKVMHLTTVVMETQSCEGKSLQVAKLALQPFFYNA